MDNLFSYIESCIKPKSNNELTKVENFDQTVYDKMVQDGIMIIESSNNSIPRFIDHVVIGDCTILRKNSPLQLEWLHTDGTIHFDPSNEPIYRRLVPPPLETVNHSIIISTIVQAVPYTAKTYVEYGVRDGQSIEKIAPHVSTAFGVDLDSYTPSSSNIVMNQMSTDEFSKNILPALKFQFAFIDADHSSKQVLIDFENVYKYIEPGGYIFLHDTYPCLEMLLDPVYCNDCYKTPLLIGEKYPDIMMLTLPLNPGLTIIKKC